MAQERKQLNWQTIDVLKFSGTPKAKWDAYVKARTPIQEEIAKLNAKLDPARNELESAVEHELVAQGVMQRGQEAVFAYRFGGMAVAVQDAQTRTGKPKLILGGNSEPTTRRRR